eukprot:GHVQ01013005.1.p1 GENE.GHVQ01013005.1~~GHVQ01013005.1.p1  ORF type:complete len:204 (-),score=11.54 GHVQ01013005.1:811-1422(-)
MSIKMYEEMHRWLLQHSGSLQGRVVFEFLCVLATNKFFSQRATTLFLSNCSKLIEVSPSRAIAWILGLSGETESVHGQSGASAAKRLPDHRVWKRATHYAVENVPKRHAIENISRRNNSGSESDEMDQVDSANDGTHVKSERATFQRLIQRHYAEYDIGEPITAVPSPSRDICETQRHCSSKDEFFDHEVCQSYSTLYAYIVT